MSDVRLGTTGAGVVEVLREKGYDRAEIGVVGVAMYGVGQVEGYVPYSTWTHILSSLPQAKFHEMSLAFAQLVSVKSDEELQLVRRSAEIGEIASQRMMEVTRPGVSESEIYAAIMYELFLNGANGLNAPYANSIAAALWSRQSKLGASHLAYTGAATSNGPERGRGPGGDIPPIRRNVYAGANVRRPSARGLVEQGMCSRCPQFV